MPDAKAPARTAPPTDQMLRRLEWQVIRRLDGLLQGDYRTLWRGAGVDLADLREYQQHDDVRHIDWNVTARLQQPYVRQFLEDRDLTAWFVLDLSGSVDFGSGDTTKLAVSAGLVATLARVLTRHGNRVGAVLWGTKVEAVMPPRSSRLHVLELLQRMRAPRPKVAAKASGKAAAAAATAQGTKLADMLHAAAGMMKRRSLVFVVSDFISQPGWEDALGRLTQRHEVIAVRLWDPMEMALPDVGLVTIEDAETGEQLFIDASDPDFRQRYADIAEKQEAALLEALGKSGADVLELATDDDLLQTLMRFADLRRQRARLKVSRRFPATFARAGALNTETKEAA
jgi:uncharacterized protein (DUF58 family)